ncbi:Tetraspannin domain containing protein, partial [Asbolus verrucosus]
QFTQPAVIEQGSYVLIGIGAFMFVVSFLGYCGALRESQCLLTTYGICLLIILVVEITVGCLAVAYKSRADEETRKLLKSSIEKYYSTPDNKDAVTLMWDHIQASLKCCGVNNYTDYQTSVKFKNSGKVIPESCCVLEGDPLKFKPKVPSCVTEPSEFNSYYKNGCFGAVIEWILKNINIVIGAAVGLGVLELVGIFLAFCLSKSLNGYIK